MTETVKYLLCLGVFAAALVSGTPAQLRPEQLERGGQWLSCSQSERNAYVYGVISGYLTGSLEACNPADDLFEIGRVAQR